LIVVIRSAGAMSAGFGCGKPYRTTSNQHNTIKINGIK